MEKLIGAMWAVEIEHDGKGSPDYYSIDSLLVDGDGVHLQVTGGTAVEFSRSCIRKLLIMRVKDSENESLQENFRAGNSSA